MPLYALALVTYFAVHSLLAAESVKAFLMRCCLPRRWYRVIYNLVALAGLAGLVFLYASLHPEPIGPAWLHAWPIGLVGGLLALAGVAVVMLAFRHYDLAEFSGLQQWRQGEAGTPPPLVTTGLNARVRHPLYFGTLLMLWGWFATCPTDAVLLSALIGSAYLWVGARLEEAKLVRLYGETYHQYQRQVPMLLPRLFGRS